MRIVKVGAFEAKTHLSELLEKVRHGAEFLITKRGKPIAELRPVAGTQGHRLRFGAHKGKILIKDDFDALLPEFEEYT